MTNKPWRALLPRVALSFGAMIGAGTFLVAKDATARFDVMELAWFRINLSFLLILSLFLLRGGHLKRISRTDLVRLALLGLTGICMCQIFFLYGMHLAPPIDGALLYAFTPALVLLAARLWLGERLTMGKVGGVALALAGVIIVLQTRGLDVGRAFLHGDILLGFAVCFWAVYTLLGKSLLRRYDPVTVNTYCFGFAALFLLPAAPFILTRMDWSQPGMAGWIGLGYLSVMTSVVAFTLWYWALRRMDAGEVAVFTNLQPPFVALLAWIFLGQIPSLPIVVGGLLVMTGVTMAQLRWRPTNPIPD